MKHIRTKEAAEAALLELPSVLGAHVREDIYGHPREVHLLVAPGPDVRHLARDVRDLLEERLGVPVDQRVISIAQLADVGAAKTAEVPETRRAGATPSQAGAETEPRLTFQGLQTSLASGKVRVQVRLGLDEQQFSGEGSELDSAQGRMRAAATAVLRALTNACRGSIRWELDGAAVVRALEHDYVLVAVLATSPRFGRQPLLLAGAHPVEDGLEAAAALAVLKATNRVLARALDGEAA
ncbi:MAG: hypothetical protein DIU52_002340 [bacterium]|jgi:hypothetical protein|nr:MAG: hypothetical protein DIU52_06070 [bacterium]